MTILSVICARGGSQGIPGKNIRPLFGKPLIVWSIELALATPEVDRVVVSTDSQEIADTALAAGAEVPFLRPDSLSGSNVGKFQVWQHALAASEEHFGETYELFVDLDCTGPLRDVRDISAGISRFRSRPTGCLDAIFSVCEARKNPYFNLVEEDQQGWLKMSKSMGPTVLARQNAPQVWEHIANFYVIAPHYLKTANHLLDGHTEGYDLGQEKGIDIDSETDFLIVEALMRKKLEDADRKS